MLLIIIIIISGLINGPIWKLPTADIALSKFT